MSDVKRLLAEATPLPWSAGKPGIFTRSHAGIAAGDVELFTTRWRANDSADAALIVHAVNRLPDYEAAVDALELLVETVRVQIHPLDEPYDAFWDPMAQADAALRRLRDEVPA